MLPLDMDDPNLIDSCQVSLDRGIASILAAMIRNRLKYRTGDRGTRTWSSASVRG